MGVGSGEGVVLTSSVPLTIGLRISEREREIEPAKHPPWQEDALVGDVKGYWGYGSYVSFSSVPKSLRTSFELRSNSLLSRVPGAPRRSTPSR